MMPGMKGICLLGFGFKVNIALVSFGTSEANSNPRPALRHVRTTFSLTCAIATPHLEVHLNLHGYKVGGTRRVVF